MVNEGNGRNIKSKERERYMLLLYVVAGYWAVGKTIYANKVRIGTWTSLFLERLILGIFLGIVLIPIAIIKVFFLNKE